MGGNQDTVYKERVLKVLQDAYINCGRMEIEDGPAKGAFRLVFNETEFPTVFSETR